MSRRWKPTVIPTAVSMYMTAAITRSAGLTRLVPEQDDRGDGGEEGKDDRAEVGRLLERGHLAHRSQPTPDLTI